MTPDMTPDEIRALSARLRELLAAEAVQALDYGGTIVALIPDALREAAAALDSTLAELEAVRRERDIERAALLSHCPVCKGSGQERRIYAEHGDDALESMEPCHCCKWVRAALAGATPAPKEE